MGFFDRFKPAELGTVRLVTPAQFLGQRGDWMKLLELHAPDGDACPVHISFRSEYSITGAVVSGGPTTGDGIISQGGPIVARVSWGVGGARNVIEFDVPPSRVPANFLPPATVNQPVNDIGNGITLNVSGSAFAVEVRNDGNLATFSAPAADNRIGFEVSPVRVQAFVSPGSASGRAPLRRMVYAAGGTPNRPLANGATLIGIPIPSFAKRVFLTRIDPATTPLTVFTTDPFGVLLRQVNVPVNSEGPIELSAAEATITVTNAGAVPAATLNLLFEVDPE
jgi:hypothetical protein